MSENFLALSPWPKSGAFLFILNEEFALCVPYAGPKGERFSCLSGDAGVIFSSPNRISLPRSPQQTVAHAAILRNYVAF